MKEFGITYRFTTHTAWGLLDRKIDCDKYSLIYFAIGQVLKLPISNVHAPGHVFVRWEFGSKLGQKYLNWEATSGGVKTDQHYRDSLHVTADQEKSGMEMRSFGEGGVMCLAIGAYLHSMLTGYEYHDNITVMPHVLGHEELLRLADLAIALDPLGRGNYYKIMVFNDLKRGLFSGDRRLYSSDELVILDDVIQLYAAIYRRVKSDKTTSYYYADALYRYGDYKKALHVLDFLLQLKIPAGELEKYSNRWSGKISTTHIYRLGALICDELRLFKKSVKYYVRSAESLAFFTPDSLTKSVNLQEFGVADAQAHYLRGKEWEKVRLHWSPKPKLSEGPLGMALKDYSAAIRKNSSHALAYRARSEVWIKLGNKIKADEDVKRYRELK